MPLWSFADNIDFQKTPVTIFSLDVNIGTHILTSLVEIGNCLKS